MTILYPYTTEPSLVPNHLAAWWSHLPEIERRIATFRPEAIVCGLGPSARLLAHVSPFLLTDVRIWGVNDFCSIMPCDDLVIMDSPLIPQSGLRKMRNERDVNPRWQQVVDSRPKRWWLYKNVVEHWSTMLPEKRDQRIFDLRLWEWPRNIPDGVPTIDHTPYDHTIASPIGTIAMAWGEGARRIGLIGVDLLIDENGRPQHHMSMNKSQLSWFTSCFNYDMRKKGGEIRNLSPFSRLNVDKYKDVEPQKAKR